MSLRKSRSFAACLSFAALAGSGIAAQAATFNLTLQNAVSSARRAWPITAGVPFAQGSLHEAAQVRLRDGAGQEVPLQSRVLTRWSDGTVKWLLLDFQADVAANATAKYTVEYGDGVRRAPVSGIKVSQNSERIMVDTGAIRFTVPKKRFALLSSLQVRRPAANGKATAAATWHEVLKNQGQETFVELEHKSPGEPQEENWLRDATGTVRDRYAAANDPKFTVRVEESGPLRVTLRLDAWHQNAAGKRFAPLSLRLSAFANSSKLRVLHTFVYSGQPKEDFIRSMGLSLPLAGSNVRAAFGAPGTGEQSIKSGEYRSLYEIGPDKFYHNIPRSADKSVGWTLGSGRDPKKLSTVAATGKEAPGWVAARTSAGSLAMAVRDFRHQHPKEVRVDGSGKLTLFFWPELGGKVLDFRRRYDYVENDIHYDLSMWEYGGLGVGKTHEFWLDAGGDAGAAERLSQSIDEPLYAMPDPQQIRDSYVFGALAPRNVAKFPRYEAWQDLAVAWVRRNQQEFRWDGMLDYGDNLFMGYGVNTHHTTVGPDAWGSRGYAGWQNDDGGLAHSLFLHALRSGDRQSMKMAELLTRHTMDVDVCHYCPPEPRHVGGGHRHDQQHWGNGVRGYGAGTQSVIDFYLLFGDERARDVARETANFHLDPTGEDEQQIGGLMRAWEITGDEKYRAGSERYLKNEIVSTEPGKWPFNTQRHFRFAADTSTNLILYRTIEKSPELDAAIVRAMHSVQTVMLSSWRDHGYLPMLLSAEAYNISKDPIFLETTKSLIRDTKAARDLDAAKDWPNGLDALPFERLVELTKQSGINNVYTFTMHGLNAVPYMLDVFERAGVTQADIDNFKPIADDPQPFQEVVDNSKITPELGHLFKYELTNSSRSDANSRSTLKLFEDGKELTQAHQPHADIRNIGQGRWSHWGSNSIWFSTSDNSDPRTNGRKYLVVQE